MKKHLAAAGLIASALALFTTGIASAGPAERLDAICIASMYDGPSMLRITVWNPEYPEFWDTGPPIGSFAIAQGHAIFTPNGRVNVTCNAATFVTPGWPPGTFKGRPRVTPRAATKTRRAAVSASTWDRGTITTTADGRVKITCHGAYAHTTGAV